jgi:DNA-binding response OmpR family regulator
MAEVPLTSTQIPETEKQRPVVLVVDDERVIADTLSVILSRSGFSVMTAYDGETAMELVAAVTPDLLLSDVMMGPGMDGTQLAIALVEACPDCKVLLFSGHAATVDLMAKARRNGHDFSLMTKPVHPADLLARINESFQSQPERATKSAAHAR